jgi:hypothetical protein
MADQFRTATDDEIARFCSLDWIRYVEEDEIDLDEEPKVTDAEGGFWMRCWVWVPDSNE